MDWNRNHTVATDILDVIGNTPLVQLKRIPKEADLLAGGMSSLSGTDTLPRKIVSKAQEARIGCPWI